MSEYLISGENAKQALKVVGVTLVDDWKDGTFNVEVEEVEEDFFIEWCEANGVEAKLI